MVMQAATNFSIGGSNPGAGSNELFDRRLNPGVASTAAAPPPVPIDQESNRRPKTLRPSALPSDQGWL